MRSFTRSPRALRARLAQVLLPCVAAAAVVACGGGGSSNPFDNPPDVTNPAGVSGQKLSFAYFQRCINPIFLAQLQTNQGGTVSTQTCAGSGCHDSTTGTGGALRITPSATVLDVTDPANTPDVIRASNMYKNFYSAQGSVVIGQPTHSRLLTKPLLMQVLHGGGLIFLSDQDPNAKLMQYWITHAVPAGADEFSTASNGMFTPPDPNTGTCNTQ